MKKEWLAPEFETLEMKETAFGLSDPNIPDSEKTQVELNGKWGYSSYMVKITLLLNRSYL